MSTLQLNERAFDAFERAVRKEVRAELGRHDCPHSKHTTMVSTPGFWEPGDGYGVGISQWCCDRCAPIVESVMRDIIGGADTRRKDQPRTPQPSHFAATDFVAEGDQLSLPWGVTA